MSFSVLISVSWVIRLISKCQLISFPELTYLLVSTKTRSSGIDQDFRTSGFTAHACVGLFGVQR